MKIKNIFRDWWQTTLMEGLSYLAVDKSYRKSHTFYF